MAKRIFKFITSLIIAVSTILLCLDVLLGVVLYTNSENINKLPQEVQTNYPIVVPLVKEMFADMSKNGWNAKIMVKYARPQDRDAIQKTYGEQGTSKLLSKKYGKILSYKEVMEFSMSSNKSIDIFLAVVFDKAGKRNLGVRLNKIDNKWFLDGFTIYKQAVM